MIKVGGEKISKAKANELLVQACHDGDLVNVVKAIDSYGADVNCSDILGYNRALTYALRVCNGPDSNGELIVKYLVNHGANINFKVGDRDGDLSDKPYFIYIASENVGHCSRISDDLVYFLIKKGARSVLEYRPPNGKLESALDQIKKNRPELYKRLRDNKIISKGVGR